MNTRKSVRHPNPKAKPDIHQTPEPQIKDAAPRYRVNLSNAPHKYEGAQSVDNLPADRQLADRQLADRQLADRLSATQQQFVLKFCSQLASVIEACEHSESAEIEVGRRQVDTKQVKVKLQAEREFTHHSGKP